MKKKYGNRFAAAATAAALTTGAFLMAPTALAADVDAFPDPGSQPASVILNELQGMGYSVAINWLNHGVGVPLNRCQVTGYHAPGWNAPAQTTVYMDVVCPTAD